jgi:bud site selection protein 31
MPRLRTFGKKPPAGFDEIEDELEDFERRMRDAVNEPHEGKRKKEVMWPIVRINWERSRYIYNLFYKKDKDDGEEPISRQLYEWLLKEKYADEKLIAKWKKPGYDFLCSVNAICKANSNFGTTSICRVPLKQRTEEQQMPAVEFGCISCASMEAARFKHPIWWDTPRPNDLVAWAKSGCPTTKGQSGGKRKRGDDDEEGEEEEDGEEEDPDVAARLKMLRQG